MPASSRRRSSRAASNGMGFAAGFAAAASVALSMGFPPNCDPLPACPMAPMRVTTPGRPGGIPMAASGNLFADVSPQGAEEERTELLRAPPVRIERIVSHGHASSPGFWYDQDQAEWVPLLGGAAVLVFEEHADPIRLEPGDHILIPAHVRHRVEWTSPDEPTVWLAVHHGA